MTDKLLCPFCNTPLVHENMSDYWCVHCNTQEKRGLYGSDKLWQALIVTKKELNDIEGKHEKLIKHIAVRSNREQELRNKLDVAVDALKKIGFGCGIPPDENYAYNYINIAADAHQQIQALEQKE